MRTTAARLLLLATAALLSTEAFAGSDNTIYVLQDRTAGNAGNTLSVDQSGAKNSLVRGLQQRGLMAEQLGGDNSAKLTIDGAGGSVQLLQANTQIGPQTGNTATIDVSGDATAIVSQTGSLNQATLDVSGNLANGSIFQNGIANRAGLTVDGRGTSASVTQNGSNVQTDLVVTGTGTSVNYTLNGNNVATDTPVNVQRTISNGASITITQSAF